MMLINAQSPAGIAEEYIIESIWNRRFPPGSVLPAERELADLIGVTRTTLREVLQRLARDGWLTIRHGKPTRVNNVLDTSGLNILNTLSRLDPESTPQLIDNLLSVRTSIAAVFISHAVGHNPEQSRQILSGALQAWRQGKRYRDIDCQVFRGLAFASGNLVYGLIINGLSGLYSRAATLCFSHPEARDLACEFYHALHELCLPEVNRQQVVQLVCQYGDTSRQLWRRIQNIPAGNGAA